MGDLLGYPVELVPGKLGNGCSSGVDALDTTDDNNLAEFSFILPDARCIVVEQDRHVLKCSAIGEFLNHNGGGGADGIEALRCYLTYNPCRQGRPWKWNPLRDFGRQVQKFGNLADTIFSQRL